MPWSSQNGGGGGGWKGGGGPWGQGPSGGGGGSPDLEEILKRSQDRLKQAMPGGGMGGIVALVALLLIAIVGYYGFFVAIQPNQKGVVLRFGEYNRILADGLQFRLPYPIEEVHIVDATTQRRLEIGKPNTSQQSVYISQSASGLDESHVLTGDENIVDMDFLVTWNVKDAKAYLFNVRNPDKTVSDVAESAMREVVGQRDYQLVSTSGRGEVEDAVHKLTQTTLDRYGAGIQVLKVQLQTVDPPRQVLDAFRDVQSAKADKDRLQNEAEAYRNTEVPNARGFAMKIRQDAQAYKEQTVAEAQGRTARFLKVYEEYAKAPDVTRKRMFLETMEQVLGGANKIVLDEKGSGVVPYLPLNELKPRGGQR